MRRRARLILFCLVVTAAAAFAVSKRQRKEYNAKASILFNDQQTQQAVAGLPGASAADQQPQIDTDRNLVALPRMAAATAPTLGRPSARGRSQRGDRHPAG